MRAKLEQKFTSALAKWQPETWKKGEVARGQREMDTLQSAKKRKLFLFQLNDKQQSSQKPAKSNFHWPGAQGSRGAGEQELDS